VILLPQRAERWIWERQEVVLLHELVHVLRHDWPLRMLARLAGVLYWFNPLSWWALHRLHREQEYACDEEVIALGTKPSTYASHLLDIARSVTPQPMLALTALGMARRTNVEGRIMAILTRSTHRRVGMALVLPAALLTATLVTAISTVSPTTATPPAAPVVAAVPSVAAAPAAAPQPVPQPAPQVAPAPAPPPAPQVQPAAGRVRELARQMKAVEQEMKAHLAELEDIELEMRPSLEGIEELEVEVNEEQMALLEQQLEPYHEQLEQVEEQMRPLLEQIEEIRSNIEPLHEVDLSVDVDQLRQQLEELGASRLELNELMELVHQQLQPMYKRLEFDQQQMQQEHKRLEQLHRQLEAHQLDMGKIQQAMEPVHQQLAALRESGMQERMQQIQESLEPYQRRMKEIQHELEPYHDRLELLADEVRVAMTDDIARLLADVLGDVVTSSDIIPKAAQALVERAGLRVEENRLELHLSRSQARRVLRTQLEGATNASADELDEAIEQAAVAVADYTVDIE